MGLLPFHPHSEGKSSITPHPQQKERKQVLQLLFIDIQVGSIAARLGSCNDGEDGGGGVFVCSISWAE